MWIFQAILVFMNVTARVFSAQTIILYSVAIQPDLTPYYFVGKQVSVFVSQRCFEQQRLSNSHFNKNEVSSAMAADLPLQG